MAKLRHESLDGNVLMITSYCPPMKLREGNAFSHVCLFTGKGGPHVTTTHDAISESQATWDVQICSLGDPAPTPALSAVPQTCPNLFSCNTQAPPPPPKSWTCPNFVDFDLHCVGQTSVESGRLAFD